MFGAVDAAGCGAEGVVAKEDLEDRESDLVGVSGGEDSLRGGRGERTIT